MTDKNFSFELQDNGIHIDNDGQRFLVSYEEVCLTWDAARKWAQERGGDLGTVEQLRTIAKHRTAINAELKAAGKEELGGGCWTNEEYYHNPGYAYVVYMVNGNVSYGSSKGNYFYVRAVSALN